MYTDITPELFTLDSKNVCKILKFDFALHFHNGKTMDTFSKNMVLNFT